MSNIQWTEDQMKAIQYKGSDILVSAAAGSGKTAVLVERIIQNILNQTYSIDELFVSTFTNLSAKDMKEKIEDALDKELKKYTQLNNKAMVEYLENERIKLKEAHISTLHSFCLFVIKNYYNTIGLSSDMRTLGEAEEKVKLHQVIERVLESQYQQNNETFHQLTYFLSGDKNNDELIKLIEKLYRISVGKSQPIAFLESFKDQYIKEESLHNILMDYNHMIKVELEGLLNDLLEVEEKANRPELFDEKALKKFDNTMKDLDALINSIQSYLNYEMGQITLKLEGKMFSKDTTFFKTLSSNMSESDLNLFKNVYGRYKKLLEYPPNNLEYIKDEMMPMNDINNCFLNIVIEVIEKFKLSKQSNNEMDFSDYEHYALEILSANNDEIANVFKLQFKEIMIDEYQDINRVQEAIIQKLKSNDEANGNLFMVGDVKQSIYKFRQADPSLFIEKFNRFEMGNSGQLITLNKNFRSDSSVIDLTNHLFTKLMDEEVGEIKYDEKHALVQGKEDAHSNSYVHLFERTLDKDDDEIDYIIQEINKLTEKYNVQYRDIVILMRNTKRFNAFKLKLSENNIPVYANNRSGYLNTLEIRTMVSILSIIDNPLQDDHLVGVMRLPMIGFTEDDIAQIRIVNDKKGYMYESLLCIDHSHHLYSKVQSLLNLISDLQVQAKYLQVSDLIDEIYHSLNILEYFSGMLNGETRKANLNAFLEMGKEYESMEHLTLYEFIGYVHHLINEKIDFGEESTVSIDDNVIRMMTIHQSKGLEFKHVFYAGLHSNFNQQDSKGRVLLHSKRGVALDVYHHESKFVTESIHSKVMKYYISKESISEELRLVYVALTRAKNSLYIPLMYDDGLEYSYQYNNEVLNDVVKPTDRLKASNVRNLIMPITSVKHLNNIIVDYKEIEENEVIIEKYITVEKLKTVPLPNDEDIYKRLTHQYKDRSRTVLPFKESVTEIKRKNEPKLENSASLLKKQTFLREPKFKTDNLSAPEFGTVMHEIMMRVANDFEAISRMDNTELSTHLDTLIHYYVSHNTFITETHKEKIKSFALSFLNDDTMFTLLKNSHHIYTELPFIMNQRDIGRSNDSDQMVQGIIDVLLKLEDEYVIIDYKTDRLKNRSVNEIELIERYATQMNIYKETVQFVLDKPVRVYLYFFDYGAIEVEDSF